MATLEQLKNDPEKAVCHYPVGWVDQSRIIRDFTPGSLAQVSCVIVGRVSGLSLKFHKRRPQLTGTLADPTGNQIGFSFFGETRQLQEQLQTARENGSEVAFSGQLKLKNQFWSLYHCAQPDMEWWGRIMPVYQVHGSEKNGRETRRIIAEQVSHDNVTKVALKMSNALKSLPSQSQGRIREVAGTPANWRLPNLIYHAHYPRTLAEGEACIEILKRYAAITAIAQLRQAYSTQNAMSRKPLSYQAERPVRLKREVALPFTLTQEQIQVVDSIISDLKSNRPSRAVLQGDVGSGKTAVYGLAAAHVYDAGGRVAILMPNRSLATQVYHELTEYWPDIKTDTALVTADHSTSEPERACLLIGTTALLSKKTGPIDLLITDEQHKLGAGQRVQLGDDTTHRLDVSATLIPRTLALAEFGALKIHRLKQCHAKKQFHKKILMPDDWMAGFNMIQWMLKHKLKALVICPKKEVTGRDLCIEDRYSAENIAAWLENYFPGQIRLAHSGQDSAVNAAAIEDVKQDRAQILVSTTVAEVGLTIPRLHYCWVIHADRLGLVSLHQITGRLARHGGHGYIHLWLPEPCSAKTMKRLSAFTQTDDGFEIALIDLEARGAGDLKPEGIQQSGGDPDILGNHPLSYRLIEQLRARLEIDKFPQ